MHPLYWRRKLTQKEFFELLTQRAGKYGFVQDSTGQIIEKKTGFGPLNAVSAVVNKRSYVNDFDELVSELGVDEEFASRVDDLSAGLKPSDANAKRLLRKLRDAAGVTRD